MKKSVKMTLFALGVGTTLLYGGIGSVYAVYDEATNTDTLTNQMVSITRGNTAIGDFKSYDHSDRNLVINWNQESNTSRADGAAIRDAEVTAKNLTIDASFRGNKWTDKGIIGGDARQNTIINVSGDINVKANNDAVYTESGGNVTFEGFKNLNVTSTGGNFGMVDNGQGITVKGGEGSTVNISASYYPAIGNGIRASSSFFGTELGKGISISANTINLSAQNYFSIYAGRGTNEDKSFNVNLDADIVNLTGGISAARGGNVVVNSERNGVVKIDKAGSSYSIYARSAEAANNITSKVSIGENSRNTVQITGTMQATSKGASILVNAMESGSFIHSGEEASETGEVTTDAIQAVQYGDVSVHLGGADSYVYGNVMANTNGAAKVYMSNSDSYINGNLTANNNGGVLVSASGSDSYVKGNITANNAGTVTLVMSGDNAKLIGDINAARGTATYPVPKDGADISVNLSGNNASHVGDIIAEGDNTIDAAYTGNGSSLTGNVVNSGNTNLRFANSSTMTGDIENTLKVYTGTAVEPYEGQLTATFEEKSSLIGDIDSTTGSAEVLFNGNSAWAGNLFVGGGTTAINLDNSSVWNGSSTGIGNVSLDNGSLWNISKDSNANSLTLSDDSVVSLSGEANHLDLNSLNGTGTFLMDVSYQGDDVTTYREGDASDYIAAHDGDGSTHTVVFNVDKNVNSMVDNSKLYFATTAANTSTFALNQAIEIQNTDKIYNKHLILKNETETGIDDSYEGYNDWYLTTDSSKGTNGNTINPNGTVPGAAYTAAFALWRDDDTLLKRLGELRFDQAEQGIWARFINKRLEKDGTYGFSGNFKTMQVGYDKMRKNSDDSTWYYGAAVSHTWGDSDYTGGNGSQKTNDLSLYATKLQANGNYLDLVARVGRIDSDYTTSYGDRGEFDNWAGSLSTEFGRKMPLQNGWSVEPQAQLTYSYLWGDDYNTANGAKVSQDSADSLVGRVGVVLSRDFESQANKLGRVYFKASLLHDFLGDVDGRITDDFTFTNSSDLGDTWLTLGLGTNLQLGKDTNFYLDVERNFGAEVEMDYRFNTGVRLNF